jgi:serine/threonine protein kinase
MEIIDNEEIETNHREESLYSSPEQNKGSGVSKKSDIYSVGLVLYEMCECFSDHDRRNKKIKYLKKYKTFENKFQKNYDLQCNLILQMIEDDEDKRPSCEELLESKEMQTWKLSINEN